MERLCDLFIICVNTASMSDNRKKALTVPLFKGQDNKIEWKHYRYGRYTQKGVHLSSQKVTERQCDTRFVCYQNSSHIKAIPPGHYFSYGWKKEAQ